MFRDRARSFLLDKLTPHCRDTALENATNLEHFIYNEFIGWARRKEIPLNWSCARFRSLYTQRVMSVVFNINNPENSRVRDALRQGTLSLPKLVQSRPEELFPERWAEAFESVALARLKKEAASIDPASVPDGAFECSKCKSKKTTYYQLQTRSADEPMTNFVNCLNCGKRWKC